MISKTNLHYSIKTSTGLIILNTNKGRSITELSKRVAYCLFLQNNTYTLSYVLLNRTVCTKYRTTSPLVHSEIFIFVLSRAWFYLSALVSWTIYLLYTLHLFSGKLNNQSKLFIFCTYSNFYSIALCSFNCFLTASRYIFISFSHSN